MISSVTHRPVITSENAFTLSDRTHGVSEKQKIHASPVLDSVDDKVVAAKTASVRPYMNFFPRARRFILEVCAKVQEVWQSFIQAILKGWHWLIGYKAPEGIPVRSPQAANLIEQASKYQKLAGVDDSLLQLAKHIHERAPEGTSVEEVSRQAFEQLAPLGVPQATHVERVGLVISALALQSIPLLAACATVIKGLDDSKKLPTAMRVAGDLAVLGILDATVGNLSPVVSFIFRTGMIATLASGHVTEKSLSEHVERWLMSQLKAADTDREVLQGLEMPASATNEQRRALQQVKIGQGSILDVRNAAAGIFGDNPLVTQSHHLKAIKTAVRIHNCVGAVSLGGVAMMVMAQLSQNPVTIVLVPLMVGAARFEFPQIASLENRAIAPLHRKLAQTELGPAMQQGLVGAVSVMMVNEGMSSVLPAVASRAMKPLINAAVVLFPTSKQKLALNERQYAAVATSMAHSLPGRVTAYLLTTHFLGNGLVGGLTASIVTSMTAVSLEKTDEYDAKQPLVRRAHATIGAASTAAHVLGELGVTTVIAPLASTLPFAAALIPSSDQIETFTTQSRARAVGEWVLASAGKAFLAYGVETLGEAVLGSTGAGVAAVAVVTATKPVIDNLAKKTISQLYDFANWATDKTVNWLLPSEMFEAL